MSFVAVSTPDAHADAWLAMREAAVSQDWRITDVGPTAWIATRRELVTLEPFAGGRVVVIGDLLSDERRPWFKSATVSRSFSAIRPAPWIALSGRWVGLGRRRRCSLLAGRGDR